MNEQSLVKKFQRLPKNQQQKIIDLIDSLLNKEEEGHLSKKRILGLNRGEIIISDDFDDPLPDSYWLGS